MGISPLLKVHFSEDRRMYKNRVSDGINVPVYTWEFPLF
jgi:hypothetical protein